MSKTLSQTQRKVLERLAGGDTIATSLRFTKDGATVQINTFRSLMTVGMITETTEWGNRYAITEAGRTALEAAKAKEG